MEIRMGEQDCSIHQVIYDTNFMTKYRIAQIIKQISI